MRATMLVPLAAILCACSKTSEQSGAARTPDSAVTTAAPVAPAANASQTTPAAAQPSSAQSRTDCGVKGQPILKDVGVGDLEVGRTAAVIKRSCLVVRDASESGSEGNVERVMTVKIGTLQLGATVANDLVWRIAVRTPDISTADGLHVGVPLTRLASVTGAKLAEGEDGLYVTVPNHCGLSFRFSVQSRTPSGRPWTTAQLIQVHGGATSDRILVTRCNK